MLGHSQLPVTPAPGNLTPSLAFEGTDMHTYMHSYTDTWTYTQTHGHECTHTHRHIHMNKNKSFEELITGVFTEVKHF